MFFVSSLCFFCCYFVVVVVVVLLLFLLFDPTKLKALQKSKCGIRVLVRALWKDS